MLTKQTTTTKKNEKAKNKKPFIRILMASIYNSQILEQFQMSFNRRMVKQIVVHLHNEILLRNKKEQLLTQAICMNLTDIMLSKRNQTQQITSCVFPFK